MYSGSSSAAAPKNGAAAARPTLYARKRLPQRTAQSRRLVEEYWLSVMNSTVERPLYHSYSDRYGGTRGIPFAARTDTSAVLRGTALEGTRAMSREELFAWCMESSEAAMAAGSTDEAHGFLCQALTQLQNSDGGLTVAALASTACADSASPAGQKRSYDTGEVLRRLGKVALLCGAPADALVFLTQSAEADPLTTEAYVLRAACYERLMEPQLAFDEYEKYMKLVPASMEVLAHCGKCAAEAGNAAAAVAYFEQLLLETQAAAAEATEGAARATAAFYEAHAHFYLGLVRLQELEAAVAEGPAQEQDAGARDHLNVAAANPAYVESYENTVNEAVAHGEFALALQQLRCLQRMLPESADYYVRAAHVCHLKGDVEGEIDSLSEALDRHQGFSARRTTLLTRGTVYAEKVGDIERATTDFALVIGLPSDDAADRCTPIAYMKRAEVLRRRHARHGGSAEDLEAALADYNCFIASLSGAGLAARPADGARRLCPEGEVCSAQAVTDALLILANGAFLKGDYDGAMEYFSRAIARGWQPQPRRPFCAAEAQPCPPPSQRAAVPVPSEGLHDQVYLATAHHVIAAHPVHEDIFKAPYEPRDWSANPTWTAPLFGAPTTDTSPALPGRKPGSGTGKLADRKDTDRVAVVPICLSYLLVDARYTALRALEPTVFSALEAALLVVWGPYRTDVERVREDASSVKGGKRTKRH